MCARMRLLLAVMIFNGLVTTSIFGGGRGWTDDYTVAKQTAEDEGKDILLDFTGSDWCGVCVLLDKEVFSKHTFNRYARKHFVLVEVDFPRDKKNQSEAVQTQNNELQKAFSVRGYPSVFLTDAEGRPYAKTGYRRGGAAAYVEHLEELRAKRIERDEHIAAAENAEGMEKAKHLHAALQVVGDRLALQHYKDVIEQIISLDADGTAGLAKRYEDLLAATEQLATLKSILGDAKNNPNRTVAKLDDFLSTEDLVASVRQEALSQKSQIQLNYLKDKPKAKAALIQAIEADPDSRKAESLRHALKRYFSDEDI